MTADDGFRTDIAISGDPRVAVVGVGGAGCRIASMIYNGMHRVGVVAVNTDRKALEQTSADYRMYICKEVTKGLGTNGDPELGKRCAQIHESDLMAVLKNYKYVYIVAGMGGGTGTGAAPVIAELCARANIDFGAVVIMPFSFETERAYEASKGYRTLHSRCEDIVRFENDKAVSAKGVSTMGDALELINESVVKVITNAINDAPMIIKANYARRIDKARSNGSCVSAPKVTSL